MRYHLLLFWTVLFTVCVLFWVSVVGCAMRNDERREGEGSPQLLAKLQEQALTEDDVGVVLAARVMREASYLPDQYAHARLHHMPQLADVEGGLPVVAGALERPVPGTEWIVGWLTRAVASYPPGVPERFDPANYIPPNFWKLPSLATYYPALRPDRACALLVTLEKPGEPQPIPGAGGAMLQVPPDYVLVPERVEHIAPWNRPNVPFEFVQNAYGQTMLRITWPSAANGISMWCQLLVEDRRVPAGVVSTPMIEINVGRL